MMTVRFASGQAIQYNDAKFARRFSEYTDLYMEKGDGSGSGWIAQVPNSCLIEIVRPCRVYDALTEQPLEGITREIKALRRKLTKTRA